MLPADMAGNVVEFAPRKGPAPRILALDRTGFFRVVYADVNGERFRLK